MAVRMNNLGRARNDGAWREWPLRRIVARHRRNRAVLETLECGHVQYAKADIIKPAALVRSRRCNRC